MQTYYCDKCRNKIDVRKGNIITLTVSRNSSNSKYHYCNACYGAYVEPCLIGDGSGCVNTNSDIMLSEMLAELPNITEVMFANKDALERTRLILLMLYSGRQMSSIAEYIGCSYHTVYRVKRTYGSLHYARKNITTRKNDITVDNVITDFIVMKSVDKLLERTSYSPEKVESILYQFTGVTSVKKDT